MKNGQITKMLQLARAMFFLNAGVWLFFSLLGFMQAMTVTGAWRLILSVLMLVNAALMVWFGLAIMKGKAWTFFLAILYMALNVVLSITDQFGWIDALILLLNLSLLGLLFLTRQRIIQAARAPSKE